MSVLGDRTVVDARVGRKLDNALTLTYRSGPGEPFATATQGGGRLGILLGFKNGGSGTHLVEGSAGAGMLRVECLRDRPTVVSTGEGHPVGAIARGEGADLVDPSGSTLARLIDDPGGHRGVDAFVLAVVDPAGARLGTFSIVRTLGAYSLLNDVIETSIWWDRAGQPLKAPLLGAVISLKAPVSGPIGDLLVAACADVCLGLRGYTASTRG